jgi:hypothetical protein
MPDYSPCLCPSKKAADFHEGLIFSAAFLLRVAKLALRGSDHKKLKKKELKALSLCSAWEFG